MFTGTSTTRGQHPPQPCPVLKNRPALAVNALRAGPVDPRGLLPHAGPHPAGSIGAERKPYPLRQWNVHQLFRRLRHRKYPTRRRTGRAGDLGHFDLCTGTKRSTIFSTSSNFSTNCGTGASRTGTPRTGSTFCSTVRRRTCSCGGQAATQRQAPHPRPWQSTGCVPPGEWGSSGSSPCSSTRSPHSPALAVLCPREEW